MAIPDKINKFNELVTQFFELYPIFFYGSSDLLFKTYLKNCDILREHGLTFWQKAAVNNSYEKQKYQFHKILNERRQDFKNLLLTSSSYIQVHNLLLAQMITQQNLTKEQFFQAYRSLIGAKEEEFRSLALEQELPSFLEVMQRMSQEGLTTYSLLQTVISPVVMSQLSKPKPDQDLVCSKTVVLSQFDESVLGYLPIHHKESSYAI